MRSISFTASNGYKKTMALNGLVIPGQAGKCASMASQQLSPWEESDAAMRGWGVEVPALFSRSDVGDMTKRKRTRKRSEQLVTKHPQKSPTCEATRSITWQSRPTTLLAPGPPAPQSTSPQRSHVSAPGNTRCSCLEGFLPALSSGLQVFWSLKKLGDVSLLLL